jgi:protein required for attachment to host cells
MAVTLPHAAKLSVSQQQDQDSFSSQVEQSCRQSAFWGINDRLLAVAAPDGTLRQKGKGD